MSFPPHLQFHVIPQTIEAATQRLPHPKGNRRRARVRIDDFRTRLLALPSNKLSQWKLKPAAQELLPYLAAERSKPELQRRVRILCLTSLPTLSLACVRRLLLSMYDDNALKSEAQKRLKDEHNPPWLTPIEHLEQDLPNVLAQHICSSGIPIHEALQSLELPSWSALSSATLSAIPKHWSAEYLKELPAAETLNWIAHSSAPVLIRNLLLKALLRRYATCIPDPQWVQQERPLGVLIRKSMMLWPYPSAMWKKAPPDAQRAARWVQTHNKLRQHLSTQEFEFWKQSITDITHTFWLPNDQILGICLERALILQHTDKWLALPCSERVKWQNRQWSSTPLPQGVAWEAIPDSLSTRLQTLKQWSQS